MKDTYLPSIHSSKSPLVTFLPLLSNYPYLLLHIIYLIAAVQGGQASTITTSCTLLCHLSR